MEKTQTAMAASRCRIKSPCIVVFCICAPWAFACQHRTPLLKCAKGRTGDDKKIHKMDERGTGGDHALPRCVEGRLMKIKSVKAFLIKSDLTGGEIKTAPRRPAWTSHAEVAGPMSRFVRFK